MIDSNLTYNQHLHYFAQQQIDVCPQIQWLEDVLKKLIQQKIDSGHQVILLVDINEDV